MTSSTATIMKAAEAGIDNVDTAISSMSMTYGHSATEAVVAALSGSDVDRFARRLLDRGRGPPGAHFSSGE